MLGGTHPILLIVCYRTLKMLSMNLTANLFWVKGTRTLGRMGLTNFKHCSRAYTREPQARPLRAAVR